MQAQERDKLLQILEARFEKNPTRHKGVAWAKVRGKLLKSTRALDVLQAMEATGGEPDVIGYDAGDGVYSFCDCAAESPSGRRSLCYDGAALAARKEHKPKGNVIDTAASIGIELLTEAQYRHLQTLGSFDSKTSSWVHTPEDVRRLGGALYCDKRYGRVFVGHNGAESYYAARGFRGCLRV
jgi:hypothetical protein